MKKRYRDELLDSKTFNNIDNIKQMRTEPFCPLQSQKLSFDSSANKISSASEKIISAVSNLKSSANMTKSSRPVERKPNSVFVEKRIASMSHIKLVNTRHKNFIIPVLPGVINKILYK